MNKTDLETEPRSAQTSFLRNVVLLNAVLLNVVLASAQAATLTVKKDGTGTFGTISACVAAMAVGDTCTVYAGTYGENVTVQAGTAANYKTLNVNPGDTVTINGSVTMNSHAKLVGFHIANPSSLTTACVTVAGNSTDWYITNNIMTSCGGIRELRNFANTSFGYIQGNTLSYMCTTPGTPGTCEGIFINGDHHLLENNDISHVSDGHTLFGQYNIIRNNAMHDTLSTECSSQNSGNCHTDFIESEPGVAGGADRPAAHNVYEGNTITNNTGGNAHVFLAQGDGCAGQCDNIIIRFNRAYQIGSFWLLNDVGTFTNVKSYNNTIVSAQSTSAQEDLYSFLAGNTGGAVKNDLMVNSAPNGTEWYTVDSQSASGFSGGHNLAYLTSCGTGCSFTTYPPANFGMGQSGVGNVTNQDPKFVNATSDWHLQSNSPAIGAGSSLTTVATADSGSGTSLVVSDAKYFQDGFGLQGVQGDWIRVGPTTTVQIVSVNYNTNTLTLANAITRSDGDPVYLYKDSSGRQVLFGANPDIGAFPSTGTVTPPPTNVHFVRAGATGSNNGSSWANAWGNVSSIAWSSLNPGDTVCVAGGTYSGDLTTGKNGTSGSPITVKRATASDPACGSGTPGWSASYDAQVVMTNTISVGNSYVTIDGVVPNGISVVMQNPTGSAYVGMAGDVGPTSHVTLRYIEVAGPCASGAICHQNNDHRSFVIEHWNGSDYDTQDSWLVQYVNLHGACNNMVIYGATNLTIEHSRLADSLDSTGVPCHPNVGNIGASGPVTFRYNEITNWGVEGLMFLQPATWNIYGNVWHDPNTGSYPRVLATQSSNINVQLFNNSFLNIPFETIANEGGSWSSSSQGRNNIYWNCNGAGGLTSDDYDYSDKALGGEAHGQGNAANPFVNSGAKTIAGYHLGAHTNPGVNVGAPYNIDYDGNARTTWDRGALEFTGSGGNPAPMLTGISPNSATAGGGQFTLTVTGSNFISGSVVQWNGANLTTTFVSASTITAVVPATDIATAGSASVTVFNPAPGGGTSTSATFTVNGAVGGLANIWLDTNGGSCARSATLVPYNDATACASMQAAQTAAQAGDLVIIKNGTYPAQIISSGGKSSTVSYAAETSGSVLVGNLQISVDRIHVKGVIASGIHESRGYLDVEEPGSTEFTDVVIDGFAGSHGFIGASNVTVQNSEFGDANVCNTPDPTVEDAFRFWGRGNGMTTHGDKLLHSVIHDWTAVPDECGSLGLHVDGMQLQGGDGLVIDGNIFYGNATSNIQQGIWGNVTLGTMLVQNNYLDAPKVWGNNLSIGQAPCSGVIIQNNVFSANGSATDNQGGCTGGVPTQRSNIYLGTLSVCAGGGQPAFSGDHNIFPASGGTTCGTNAKRCAPQWLNGPPSAANGYDMRLNSSDTCAKDAANPTGFPPTDFYGTTRPQGAAPDTGPYEIPSTSTGIPAPVITSALSATGTVGSAFSYQITASNSPTSFNATGLPAGLSVNTGNGLISGTPTTAGTSNVTLSATNAGGTGNATLVLVINSVSGCGTLGQFFPSNNPWNTDISTWSVHPNSANYLNSIGVSGSLHPDFGTVYPPGSGIPWGIPYIAVHSTEPLVPINFTAYGSESDPGPYPIPLSAPIEGGTTSTGDRHVIGINVDSRKLFEMFNAYPNPTAGRWDADSGAVFDLTSNQLRPAGWTSADAAGLPILPGLVRHDEVACGAIKHALRFTVQNSQASYIFPARHFASSSNNPNLPPMGLRFRLKASVDISGYPADVQVILTALKKYGMFVADNGSNWFLSGAPDPQWNDSNINLLKQIHGSDFEVVDTTGAGSGGGGGNPVPSLTSISPSSATAGAAAFTLTVNGTNFINSSIVRWNGSNRLTTFVSATRLTASILAADIAAAGTASVTAFNPAPGGGTSNALTFTINGVSGNPPVITSALTASGIVGMVFSYQITATNNPTSFSAAGLPTGLSINTSNGLISGTPTASGTNNITISATNGFGTGNATLVLTISSSGGGSGNLPTPTLDLPTYLPVNGTLNTGYPLGYNVNFVWTINLASQQAASSKPGTSFTSSLLAARLLAGASSANFRTQGAAAALAAYGLVPGFYTVTVQAVDASGNPSGIASANITLVAADLSGVRVYPNPWRSDKHSGRPFMTFDNLTVDSAIKIFTVSGHLVKTLPTASSSVTWDLTNESGDKVASGLYVYLIKDGQNQKKTGTVALIK